MSNRQKSGKQNKSIVECGLGDKCARRNCIFKHPECRNLEANIRQEKQEKLNDLVRLEERQRAQLMQLCRNQDGCAQLSCPYRHPPRWNPVHNQQIIRNRRGQDEQRREQQRQHAQNVCQEEGVDSQSETHRQHVTSSVKSAGDDEYQYDDDYFDVYEKIWDKQAEVQLERW